MSLSAIDYLLWGAATVLLLVTCGALLKRKLVEELPAFSVYVAFHVVRTVVLFAIYWLYLHHRTSYADYFYVYWTAETGSIVLGFAVIYEIYGKVFQNYRALRQLGGILFTGAAVVLLVAAVLTAAAAPGADDPGVVRAVFLLERSVRVMQCGLLGLLFVLAFCFGLRWRNRVFGIALGFGLFASIELAAVAVRSQVGVAASATYSQVASAAYSCGVLIWVCYLVAPEPALQYRGAVLHHDLEKWNQALQEMLQR